MGKFITKEMLEECKHQALVKTTIKMLKRKISPEIVAKCTDLPISEVKRIKKENNL